MSFLKQTLSYTLASFLGTLLALAAAGAVVWFTWIKPIVDWVIAWWTTPLNRAVPFPLTPGEATYQAFWLPLIILAVVFAVEGALLVWGLWRLKPKGE